MPFTPFTCLWAGELLPLWRSPRSRGLCGEGVRGGVIFHDGEDEEPEGGEAAPGFVCSDRMVCLDDLRVPAVRLCRKGEFSGEALYRQG